MRRQRPTSSERLRLLKKIDANIQLDKRRRHLYNKKFHRSFIFIATWFIRLIYLLLFIIVLIFNDKSGDMRPEIVQDDNAEGKIVHTGIILPNNKIIHASGKVHVDKLDHKGIFNEETNKYTHQLKVIKRIF